VIHLRQTYGHIPYRDDLKAQVAESQQHNQVLAKLAERIKAEAAKVHDRDGLTPRYLAQKLDADPRDVRQALQRYSSLFPWARQLGGGNLDLELAARVGYAIQQAPLGIHPEELVAQLKKDPDFRAMYPSFNTETLDLLRQAYPKLVPDWYAREQLQSSRVLVDAILTAPKGKKFEAIIAELRKKHPRSFPSDRRDYYLELWKSDPKRFGFTVALRGPDMKLRLDGQGAAPLPERTRTALDRLAQEIPLIPTSQPVVQRVADLAPKNVFQDYEFVAVQHMLGVLVPFMDICKGLGIHPDRATVVGTAYTANQTVCDVLQDRGWDARRTPLDLSLWKEEVRGALYDRVASALKSGRKILALDDGGMITQLLREDPYLRDHAALFSIVEQTRRGITVADQDQLSASLINVAQSLSKVFVEGPIIGEVLHEKLVQRLERLGIKSVKGMKIGVVGKGAVGGPLAAELRKMGAIVVCRDTDESKLTPAEKKLSEAEFFGGKDLILGTTGVESIGPEQLALIDSGTIIGSCSSKLVEIDMAELTESAKNKGGKIEVVDDESFPPTVRYTLPSGKQLTVLAQGYPLNFTGAVNTTDPDKIQMTRALLLLGMIQATKSKIPEVHRLELQGQLEILEYFATLPAAKSDPELAKAIPETIAKIKAALKDPDAFRTRAVKKLS
jgi:S-adenosylhomocysteine hydrolase